MLDLRPTCEHCAAPLPPSSTEARICSYECTFCRTCVETVLGNVCPNCGGGFVARPVRPVTDWTGTGTSLAYQLASTRVVSQAVDPTVQAALVARAGAVPPEAR